MRNDLITLAHSFFQLCVDKILIEPAAGFLFFFNLLNLFQKIFYKDYNPDLVFKIPLEDGM